LPKGADHVEHAERKPITGSGGGAPAASRAEPLVGVNGPKLKAFCPFSYKRGVRS